MTISDDDRPEPDTDPRLVGILLHRLLEHLGLVPADGEQLARTAQGLLRRDERLSATDVGRVVREAVDRYRRLATRPDLSELFRSARAWHEVPVVIHDGRRLVHGSIDMLLVDEGRAWVVEFKSGRPHLAHERQLARYVEAVRRLLPGVEVEARLVYSEGTPAESA